jgi:hypothetical protein
MATNTPVKSKPTEAPAGKPVGECSFCGRYGRGTPLVGKGGYVFRGECCLTPLARRRIEEGVK